MWLEPTEEEKLYEIKLVKQAETSSSKITQSREKSLKDLKRNGVSSDRYYKIINLLAVKTDGNSAKLEAN